MGNIFFYDDGQNKNYQKFAKTDREYELQYMGEVYKIFSFDIIQIKELALVISLLITIAYTYVRMTLKINKLNKNEFFRKLFGQKLKANKLQSINMRIL